MWDPSYVVGEIMVGVWVAVHSPSSSTIWPTLNRSPNIAIDLKCAIAPPEVLSPVTCWGSGGGGSKHPPSQTFTWWYVLGNGMNFRNTSSGSTSGNNRGSDGVIMEVAK